MDILKTLNINKINSGACIGGEDWIDTSGGIENVSYNPATEEPIATVIESNESHYERIINAAHESYLHWRTVPAPVRGQLVREMGDSLRRYKDVLGSLVSLEMGKIKQEGDGEVQEMIDIAEFSVGQSRMLYGKTMHSERK